MEIAEQIRALIRDQLSIPKHQNIDLANIREDLGADSLDCIEILTAVEEFFSVDISNEEFNSCLTVDDFIACVIGKIHPAH